MTLRGPYRAVYDSIWDDPDFIALGRDGQQLWFVLKHALGPSGIAVVSMGDLEDLFFARDRQELDAFLRLLRDREWIQYDAISRRRLLIWLRNGLLYEPTFSLGNVNHAKTVLKHVETLPRHPIVVAFVTHYEGRVARSQRTTWTRVRDTLRSLCVQDPQTRTVPIPTPTPQLSIPQADEKAIPMPSRSHADPLPDHDKRITDRGEREDLNHVLLERSGVKAGPREPAPSNGGHKHGGSIEEHRAQARLAAQRSTPRSHVLDEAIGAEDPRHGRILRVIGGLRPEKPAWLDELLQDLENPHEGISHLNQLAREIADDASKSRPDWIRIVQEQLGALERSAS